MKIATVLSWINLIFWGLVVVLGLLSALIFQSLGLIVIVFLFSAIVLHSYAALQLQKSIKKPAIPLSSQTPVGIRFVGFFALFFGVIELGNGISTLQDPQEILKMIAGQFPQFKGFTVSTMRMSGVFTLLIGLCITVNVFLNFRLLRWYTFQQQQNKGPEN